MKYGSRVAFSILTPTKIIKKATNVKFFSNFLCSLFSWAPHKYWGVFIYVTDTHMPTSKIKHVNIYLCVLQKSSLKNASRGKVPQLSKAASQKTVGGGGRLLLSVLHLMNGAVVCTFTHCLSVHACGASTRADPKERKCWLQRYMHTSFY